MKTNIEHIKYLVNHLLAQKSSLEMEKALADLLTESELEEVAKRLQIFELLEKGLPQRQIADQLGVGIATVSRGSSVLKKRGKI